MHYKLPYELEDRTIKHSTFHNIEINEQQVAQEETERLYLQQFSVLKEEIQGQKQTIDKQTMYL